jgi:hypothetical protein
MWDGTEKLYSRLHGFWDWATFLAVLFWISGMYALLVAWVSLALE